MVYFAKIEHEEIQLGDAPHIAASARVSAYELGRYTEVADGRCWRKAVLTTIPT